MYGTTSISDFRVCLRRATAVSSRAEGLDGYAGVGSGSLGGTAQDTYTVYSPSCDLCLACVLPSTARDTASTAACRRVIFTASLHDMCMHMCMYRRPLTYASASLSRGAGGPTARTRSSTMSTLSGSIPGTGTVSCLFGNIAPAVSQPYQTWDSRSIQIG